ncbi:hypothetical protein V6N11_028745 [Hibiscus sabdariffa]|uniref:Uncharacterized protein n=1 Tax=Hibiscus sabdariffa TaxID=183260 RepID=A0ABR2PRA5_9ROSI
MEARQLQLIVETKVFQNLLINFLCFKFLEAANFFSTAQPKSTAPATSAADPSTATGHMKPLELSFDASEDIFDWHTPLEHHVQPSSKLRVAVIPECSHAQKRKAPAPTEGDALSVEHPPPEIPATNTDPGRRKGKAMAGRIITRDRYSSPDDEEQSPPRPPKR